MIWRLQLCACILLYHAVVCGAQLCANISKYERKVVGSDVTRMTSINDGKFIIQALATLSTPNSKCSVVSAGGLATFYAMKFAIDHVNANKTLSRLGKLGLQMDDVCSNLPITMARGIEIISLHRPNSVCRADFLRCSTQGSSVTVKPATAVLGTGMSFTTIPLASLMSLYAIPQVSYSASSRLLSKNDLYKSFFRTIPSDSNQIKAMIALFKRFNWNFLFAVGTDDDYGKLGINDLKQATTSLNNVCIVKDEYIPYDSKGTEDRINDIIAAIKEEHRAKVVVLFTYVETIGEKFLERAKQENISRLWITSEAWNPAALSISPNLKDQAVGTLSVSIKVNSMAYFDAYMKQEIKENWKCNMWFENYLRNIHRCEAVSFDGTAEVFHGKDGCKVTLDVILNDVQKLSGRLYNIIDSVDAVAHAIYQLTLKHCKSDSEDCSYLPTPSDITNIMLNVSFINRQGKEVSFDDKGDPKYAEYTIENLQFDEQKGKYKYVQVGQWNSRNVNNELALNVSKIVWPEWFDQKSPDHVPSSVCTETCAPGKHVAGRSGCCWVCQPCKENAVSEKEGAENCTTCPVFFHANDDHTKCLRTPQRWLQVDDSAGLVIIIISGVGLAIVLASSVVIVKLWDLVKLGDRAPFLNVMSLFLIILTFAYGPLHILEPTDFVCRFQNSSFFLLLMLFAALLLVKSKFITKSLSRYSLKTFGGGLVFLQIVFIIAVLSIQLVTVLVWVYKDNVGAEKVAVKANKEILLQCKVDFTAARLIATFLPCVVLIIATSCAFRERNIEHSFYEPKFLSFTCIALCIIMLAFLPTFKYVIGEYRAIVMAFTIDVFGYTYMTCMILPKVYVGVFRLMNGKDMFPMKINNVKNSKKDQQDNKPTRTISVADMIESSDAVNTPNEKKMSKKEKEKLKKDFTADENIHFNKFEEETKSSSLSSYNNSTFNNDTAPTSNGTTANLQTGKLPLKPDQHTRL